MKRRTLLSMSALLGGLLAPWRSLAQEPQRSRAKPRARRSADEPARTAQNRNLDDDPAEPEAEPAAEREEVLPSMPGDAGQQWKVFDISKYSALPHKENNPQNSIVDWIFRRTTTAPWHGDRIAVLSAGRSKIRVYHTAKIIDQVAEVIDRFVDTDLNFLSFRVRFVSASDTRWRYTVYRRLNLISSGPQGQQVWTVKAEDAAMILGQMQLAQGARLLTEKKFEMINGQVLTVATTATRSYTGGLQRENSVAQGMQPKAEELEEGVTLRLSPLLSYEGDTLDAGIMLTTNNVRTSHPTRVLSPREVGPGESKIDVPEVSETQLNQTIKGWHVGETLLISAGIQPGILQAKGGFLNMKIPGTIPTSTELLVFLDVDIAEDNTSRRTSDRGRSRR